MIEKIEQISPMQAGIRPGAIHNFLDRIEQQGLNLHNFMMLRYHKSFAQGSYAPFRKDGLHMLFSMSKSFTSTAIGFAGQLVFV